MKELSRKMREERTGNRRVIKSLLLCCLFLFLSSTVGAQDFQLRKGNCMPDLETNDSAASDSRRARLYLPSLQNTWNSEKIYRQLVILIEFKNDSVKFKCDSPREVYDSIFNVSGYNQRKGVSCVADYFREQSGGLVNFQFDVFGPYTVDYKAQPSSNPSVNTRNYGRDPMIAATKLFLQENATLDFSPYDWDNNGTIEQVIFVHAGFSGNIGDTRVYGYLWPNTSSFTTQTTHDSKKIFNYSASAELWPNSASCGFGTICHEFSHSLGLPDIYPTTSNAGYSVLDEWDLMDGGNFTNYGWCPPNYTPMEKYLLGWVSFEELTAPTTVENLAPSADGGSIYKIPHSDNEYLLLENRQQKDWDLGAPGKGLVVYHVYYDAAIWSANKVNNDGTKRRYNLVSADNMDYDQWYDYLTNSGKKSQYQQSGHMNSWLLSTAPYPYADGETLQDELTDTSTPAAQMNGVNSENETLLGKPITNIRQNADGTISFDFMGGNSTSIIRQTIDQKAPVAIYDLSGRVCQSERSRGIYLQRQADGTIRKVLR